MCFYTILPCENVTDSTAILGRGLKKSFKGYTKEASQLVHSFSDFVDVQEFVTNVQKSIQQEEHQGRTSNIIHSSVACSYYSPAAHRKFSGYFSNTTQEDIQKNCGEEVIDNPVERQQ